LLNTSVIDADQFELCGKGCTPKFKWMYKSVDMSNENTLKLNYTTFFLKDSFFKFIYSDPIVHIIII